MAVFLLAVVGGCGKETVATTAPIVTSTTPAAGSTGVPVNQIVSATFSEAMNPSSVGTSTFLLTGPGTTAVVGSVTYTATGSVASFTPAANLAYNTVYTATITTGVTNTVGVQPAASYSWSFTTATQPTVIATVPANGATGVPVAQVLSATFSKAMNPATITNATFLLAGPGNVAVAGTVTYNAVGSVASFTPTVSLAYGTLYTATITTGVTDSTGDPMAVNYVWSFTTATQPTVIATVPANGATGVPVAQVLSATFSKTMNCATLPANFKLSAAGVAVAGTVGCSGAVATFTPTALLVTNTLYTATITTGATDSTGDPLAANYVWTFRTAPAATTPAVITVVPANGATGVATNQTLAATFSEAMNPATINGTTFLLKGPGTTAVTGVVTYVAAGSVATFTPAVALAASTLYTATITTGAMDLSGNALPVNYVWTFTTAPQETRRSP